MNAVGYFKIRACLDDAGYRNCAVTNPDQAEDGVVEWVTISISPESDPALVLEALAKGDLLYYEGPMIVISRNEDTPQLEPRGGIGNYLLFLDMN